MNRSFGQTGILFLREFRHLIFSPASALSALFFLLGTGIPFFAAGTNLSVTASGFRQYASLIPYVSVIVIAALTMGAWADEKKTGTCQILLSLPASETVILSGKFLSVLAVYSILIALTVPVVLLSPIAGPAVRYIFSGIGSVIAAYLIIFLSGSAYIAAGLFFSVLFGNAIASFLVTTATLTAFTFFSFSRHFEAASRGIIDTRDVVFYLVPGVVARYLAALVLYFRRKRRQ